MQPSFGRMAVVLALSLVLGTLPARATPLSGDEILKQFNLVVFGNLDSTSEVEGRTYVGGNLTGSSSTYFTRGPQVAPSDYEALTVGGNVTGGDKNLNNGGSAVIGGNLDARINLNGSGGMRYVAGNVNVPQNGPTVTGPVTIPDFQGTLTQLSVDLAGLSANSTATITSNRGIFTGMPDSDGLAVFLIDGPAFFNSIGELDFKLNGATTVIVNIAGTALTIAENFLGGIGETIAPYVLWNFVEATSITFGAEFFGSILAPYASITNSNSLNGSVVAANFTQRGEVHLPVFAGDLPEPSDKRIEVPEPATALLLLPGVAGLLAVRRRMRRPR